MGIWVVGDNNLVQRNCVLDTGGCLGSSYSYGIQASADVIDNTVVGVFSTGTNDNAFGIRIISDGTVVRNNRVHGLQASGSGLAYGIFINSDGIMADGNHVFANSGLSGIGIRGKIADATACSNNVVRGFTTAMSNGKFSSSNTNIIL